MKSYDDNSTAKCIEVGTIVRDWFDEGIRVLIMRGPACFCVYLGIPKDHPLAGHSYDDMPIECHGGLTFSSSGRSNRPKSEKTPIWPEGYWWYGYDYAHLGDKIVYDYSDISLGDKDWTIKEIENDSWEAVYSFKQLMRLAEKIAA